MIPDCATGRHGHLMLFGGTEQPLRVTVLDQQPGVLCGHGDGSPMFNLLTEEDSDFAEEVILTCLCGLDMEDLT